MANEESPLQPIAIIGYACRLSGHVTSPQDLWELCHSARSGWGPIPKERFSFESYHHPNPSKKGTFNPAGGYFLAEDIARFDAPFFNVTVQEATSMDPQQRMLLECSYEAFESAGFPKENLAGRSVGVFVGASFADYDTNNMRDLETVPMYHSTGCANALQSNRLSYYFDLRGPSFTVDTACSSSLVALHQAVQSLRTGESQEALVGGCHLNITPDTFAAMSASQLFNDEGKTYALDERAKSGYARGEGAGVVILKRLDAAVQDGDTIRAVIASSGVNQDGRTQGITLPNGEAQERLIRQVYREALLNPQDCGFVEMHGTGTKAGDPIEAAGVHRALGAGRSPTDPLYVGSSKSNFGHLEGASGMVSIIKAAMMLEKGQLLPNADFRKPNPEIPMEKWNMVVPPAPQPWPQGKKYVSVSNYGFGGTNAHVVLQKHDPASKQPLSNQDRDPKRKLFVISANDKESLRTRVNHFAAYIEQHPDEMFENLAYSLGSKMSTLPYRVGVSASSPSELGARLSQLKGSPLRVRRTPTIGFVFTGQGAQWAQMGVPLIDGYPVFASAMHRADQCLRKLGAPFSLLEVLREDAETSEINSPHVSQPACSALQIALVDLLRSWGIWPASVVGHSSGEISAAYAAEEFDLEAAMTLAYRRGEMTQLLKKSFPDIKGTMIAVGAGPETVKPILNTLTRGYATIACVNSPSSVTVSGDVPAVDELGAILQEKEMFNRRLKVDVAYHSNHMKNIADEYLKSIKSVQPSSSSGSRATFYSSVTGERTKTSDLGPSYWVSNLTSPVLFSNALGKMVADEANRPDLIIEVGPHSALKGPILDTLKRLGPAESKISYSATILRKLDPAECLLDTAATSNTLGAALDMTNVNFPSTGARECSFLADLPRYPWQHDTRYWHDSRISRQHLTRDGSRNDVLGVLANYSNELEPTWRNIVRLEDMPWLSEHRMQGLAVYPMSGYISMAIEAAQRRAVQKNIQFSNYELREVLVGAALVLNGDTDVETTITLRPYTEGTRGSSDVWDEFRICSWTTSRGWTEHCSGMIRVRAAPKEQAVTVSNPVENEQEYVTAVITKAKAEATSKVDSQHMYRVLTELGADYGPLFRGIENCMASPCFSYGDLIIRDTKAVMPKQFEAPLTVHPAFLDGLLHVIWPVLGKGGLDIEALHMPTSIKKMLVNCHQPSRPGHCVKAYGMTSSVKGPTKFDFLATPETSNTPLITIEGLTMTPIKDSGVDASEPFKKLCYKFQWHTLSEMEPESASSDSDGYVKLNGTDSTMNPRDVTIAEFGTSDGVADKLKSALSETTSWTPSVTSLNGLLVNNKKHIIILQTGSQSLRDLSRVTFQSIKRKLLDGSNVLWVYRADNPDGQLAVGLGRTMRQEALANFATLGLSPADFTADPTGPILASMDALWPVNCTAACRDFEFTSNGTELLVQRAVEDDATNAFVHNETHAMSMSTQPYSQPGRRLKVQIGNPGALDSLYFEDDEAGPLGDDEIELEVKATGVNFKDIVVSMGELAQPYIGVECTGVVSSVGANVQDLQVGQRVMAMTEGAYSTYARCRSTSAAVIPDNMSFELAATIPVVYCTAYYALFDLGRLTAGERVLIHAGAGGVGQAAIMLAQMTGADVFVTVGSLEKKEFVMKTYGIPNDRIFYSRDHSFARGIKRVTNGDGVDVVLNSLAGELLRESWEILAPFGRFVEIGKADITKNTRLDMNPFEWNIIFASVDLTKVAELKPQLMKRLLNDVCREMESKDTVKPISPVTVFSITDIEKAFRTLQTGKCMGKLVVCPQPGDVAKCTTPKSGSLFRPDASYILVGGTGGIGRSIARFMSSKGARNLILVSRSASINDHIKALIDEVAANGTRVVVKACDVSSRECVDSLVKQDIKDLPPVRGVIHGTMVLRDMLFERMALEDFTTVTAGKVEGAWNLHHALADSPLDFFVALSSVSGVVGGRGQGGYAAANVFLDGFMEYRRGLGLPGTSIDLSTVTDVGFMAQADAQRQEEIMKNFGSAAMTESEVLALVSAAVSGALDSSCSGQCINGLNFAQEPSWANDAKFDILYNAFKANQAHSADGQGPAVPLQELMKRASSKEEARQVCFDAVAAKIAQLLVVPIDEMDPSVTISALGIDSLSALEIRNWIGREAGAKVQVLELLSCGSLMALAEMIIAKSTVFAT